MSLRFYLGPAGAGKSTALQEDLLKRIKDEPDRHYFVIVPDQFTMETQKQLVAKSPSRGLMNVDILSFSRLAYRIFEEVGTKDKVMLDDTGKNLILRKLALDNASKLPFLGTHIKKQGFIHEIKSAVSEFMQYGIDVDKLEKLIDYCKDKPMLTKKLTDLKLIYSEFLKYIEEKYLTTEEKLELLARELKKSELASGSVVILDGFTGFTPVQEKVILSIMELADEVWVSFTVDKESFECTNDKAKTDIFGLTLTSINKMTKLAKEAGISIDTARLLFDDVTPRHRDSAVLSHLARNIFRYPYEIYEDTADAIKITVAKNPRQELIAAAVNIRKLVEEQGYQYRDFAIVSGNVDVYSEYAKEIFDMYDIPVFMDGNKKLSLNPFAEYIKSGLLIVSTNYSYESVMHFLRAGIIDISYEDIDAFDNYLRALGIRGYNKYKDDFVRYADYMKEDVEGKSSVTESSTNELKRVNAIRCKLMSILEPLIIYKRTGKYSARAITQSIYSFVSASNTYERLCEYEAYFENSADYVRAKEYSQVYEKIMNILEQMALIIGEDEVTISEYYQVFDAGLSEIKIGVLPPGVDICGFGDIERTRLSDVKCLMFIGVNEGVVPKSSSGGGIISDLDREFITESEFELSPSPRQQMYIQKLYLYMLMSGPSKYLYISYSKSDEEGKGVRPSFIIGNIMKMFPKIMENNFDALAEDNIYSEKTAYSYISDKLRDYASYPLSEGEKAKVAAVYSILNNRSNAKMEKLIDAAFASYGGDILSRELIKALYGMKLNMSVSKLEKYAACAYSHFLRYGLMLEEREEYAINNSDLGTIFHDSLHEFGEELKSEGIKWNEIDDEAATAKIDRIVDKVTLSYGESVIYSSARNAYLVKHFKRILKRTVMSVKYQLSKGAFEPASFEVGFRHVLDEESLKVGLSKDEKLMITGVIDRVDLCKEDDKIYVKIVDYKSSKREIDLVEMYKGLQLQLVVYLDQTVKSIKKNEPDREVIPAAMLYYHVEDPIIEGSVSDTEDRINELITDELRGRGIINNSREVIDRLDTNIEGKSDVIRVTLKKDGTCDSRSQTMDIGDMNLIMDYVTAKITDIGRDILSGDVSINPCDESSCKWCAYKNICGFDGKIPGYNYKVVDDVTKDNVLTKMQETVNERS